MTVTTNPVVTGIPTSPFVQNARVTTNGNVTGIPATSDGTNSTTVDTNPIVSGHTEARSAREALTNILSDGSTVANYRQGVGLTGTTNASAWANQIGAAGPLLQASGPAQPTIEADGSVLFDGSAQRMAMATTLAQPISVYAVLKKLTWTLNDAIWDGTAAGARMLLYDGGVTPGAEIYAGTAFVATNTGITLNVKHLVNVGYNGASSFIQVDAAVATTGNPGAQGGAGITLGSTFAGTNPGNVQFYELIIRNVADSAEKQAQIKALLKTIHGTP